VGPVSTLRIGEVADLLGVSADTVRRLADDGTLATARSEAGHRTFDGAEVARYLAARRPAGTSVAVSQQSARNRFEGVVTAVAVDGVAATVELQAGPHRVVSLMTREAVEELGLQPGVPAIASIKSTNVVVELPVR